MDWISFLKTHMYNLSRCYDKIIIRMYVEFY